MLSIKVKNGIVISHHRGASLPAGNIEITQAQFDTIMAELKAARDSGINPNVLYSNGVLSLDTDTRPTAGLTVNGGTSNVRVNLADPITVQFKVGTLTRDVVAEFWGRRFLFSFVNGVATKLITFPKSGIYELKGNEQVKIATPILIDVVE